MALGPRLVLALALVGCAGRNHRGPEPPRVDRLPTPTVRVGECAAPERDGVVSAHPERRRDDHDLDGDGVDETVVADDALCSDGNCYWNVFVRDSPDSCERFAGAIAGAAIEPAPVEGSRWPDIRAYWKLGEPRLLIHTYRFQRGGYQLTEALLCRRQDDDRLLCAEDQ